MFYERLFKTHQTPFAFPDALRPTQRPTGDAHVFLEELPNSLRKLGNSSRKLGNSSKEIPKWAGGLCISFPDLCVSLEEIGKFFFRPSQGLLLQKSLSVEEPLCRRVCLHRRMKTDFKSKMGRQSWRPFYSYRSSSIARHNTRDAAAKPARPWP